MSKHTPTDAGRAAAVYAAEVRRLREQRDELVAALENLLNEYVQGAASGDWGNWDYDNEDIVVAARAVLAKAKS